MLNQINLDSSSHRGIDVIWPDFIGTYPDSRRRRTARVPGLLQLRAVSWQHATAATTTTAPASASTATGTRSRRYRNHIRMAPELTQQCGRSTESQRGSHEGA